MSRFDLRPYQHEFLTAVRRDFQKHQHVLGVAATGAGKTILASELMRGWEGNCLFLADAQELVLQNADKYYRYSGELAGVEMSDHRAMPGDRVVIATTQSICRRLAKWRRDYFSLIIVDECFPYQTKVWMADGTRRSIGRLVREKSNQQVMSFNRRTGEFEPRRITGWVEKPLEGEIVRVAFGTACSVFCTANHEFLTTGGMVRADALQPGDLLVTAKDSKEGRPVLDHVSRQVALSGMLGDGYSAPAHQSALTDRIIFTAHIRHVDYLRYKQQLLDLPCNWDPIESGYNESLDIVRMASPCNPAIRKLNQLTRFEQIAKLGELGLALHYFDDGSYCPANGNSSVCLAEWTGDEADAYAGRINTLFPGTEARIYETTKGPVCYIPRAAIEAGSYGAFLAKHCVESMQYKLPRKRASAPFLPQRKRPSWHVAPVRRVYRNYRSSNCKPRQVFCLEVEDNHNFQVGDGVVVSNCHRNTLGSMAAKVLLHFGESKVLGVTATPSRSDRKQLGSFYEKVSIEIGLARLIKERWLSRIIIKSVPLSVDLSKVRTQGGDYSESDLGEAISPHLREASRLLARHARGRRTVVFLPLIATSQAFVKACQEEGLRAVHVDGKDRDGLRAYEREEYDIISNASLLSTGWDHPPTDCVMVLRPTKSLSLFQQMVGRGSRICDGKENLLLLDPLFLTDDHTLIKPARLIARNEDEAKELNDKLASGQAVDLLEAEEDNIKERESRLAERLNKRAKRKARTMDAIEFCLSLHAVEIADYEPEFHWESKEPSDGQLEALTRAGFDPDCVSCRGHASKILDLLFTRQEMGMATPKQLAWLRKLGHEKPEMVTKAEAQVWLGQRFNQSA